MKSFSLILGLLGLLTATLSMSATSGSATTAVLGSLSDLPLPVSDVQHTLSINGSDVQFNGTYQQLDAYLKVHHPDFDLGNRAIAVDFEKHLNTPREAANKNGVICCYQTGWGWGPADYWAISNGINYLNGHGRIGIEARSCGRISCSYDSAIYACNDNPYWINPSGPYLGTYAWDLVEQCRIQDGNGRFACGQEFDSDNYNVIVRADNC